MHHANTSQKSLSVTTSRIYLPLLNPHNKLIILRYSKFVDSHLKPYRCKIAACADNKFSSTACLLRHEREAHAMHGHGDKPFLCKYDGCERGVTGNGFPRRWNLYDHMKRVHNDPCTSRSAGGSPPPTEKPATGSKKRKQDTITEPTTSDMKKLMIS